MYKVYTVAYQKIIMKLAFLLFIYLLVPLAFAGPQDKWIYIGSNQLDGIALLLAVGAFVWAYLIFRDLKLRK
ncbi:MAG: hypothetical protein KQA38_03225 [Candidatus Aenigmarchaeota archaeon]|nr:hypothetical protein [Candidatus Aenigmarchaeota archaeon]